MTYRRGSRPCAEPSTGAAEGVAARIGGLHFPMYRREQSRTVATIRTVLDEHSFTAAWAEGQAMTLEQAIAFALEEPDAEGG